MITKKSQSSSTNNVAAGSSADRRTTKPTAAKAVKNRCGPTQGRSTLTQTYKARMRRLRRPWRSRPETPEIVAQYLARAGLVARLPQELFQADLLDALGHAANEFLDSLSVYQVDNESNHVNTATNLDMGLAIRSRILGSSLRRVFLFA